MSTRKSKRSRLAGHVNELRAARLLRFVRLLAERPRKRPDLLAEMRIGVRTFYRELGVLRSYGLQIRLRDHSYCLLTPAAEAEGVLPTPDPRLSLAELRELAAHPGNTARRLSELSERLVARAMSDPTPSKKRRAERTTRRSKK
jgi:predicted DNA-binding transcriptional regulator YafY